MKIQEKSNISCKSKYLASAKRHNEHDGEVKSTNASNRLNSNAESKTLQNPKETKNSTVSKNQSKNQSNTTINKIGANKQKKRDKWNQTYKHLDKNNTQYKNNQSTKASIN